MLTGESGILKQAQVARDLTQLEELKDNLRLDILDVMTGKNGDDLNKSELRELLVEYFGEENVPEESDPKWDSFPKGFVFETKYGEVDMEEVYSGSLLAAGAEATMPEKWKKEGEEATVTPTADGAGNVMPIPDGFHYVEGTKDTGFVISDDDGNEFVWVPCGDGENEVTYEKNNGDSGTTWRINQDSDGTKYSSKQDEYTEYNDWKDDGGDITSVETYGGFYIARYEAGIPDGKNGQTKASFYTEGAGEYNIKGRGNQSESAAVADLKPVSKKNHPSWNLITQENAVKVSSNMYKDSISVTSSLVDSYAWDTIVEWIKIGTGAVSKVTNSTTYGNYRDNTNIILPTNGLYAIHAYCWKGSVEESFLRAKNYFIGSWKRTTSDKKITTENKDTDYKDYDWSNPKSEWDFNTYTYREQVEIGTGAAEATKIKNIYDLAGNVWEWTTETGQHHKEGDTSETITYAVFRGGSFGNNGSSTPVCYRNANRGSRYPHEHPRLPRRSVYKVALITNCFRWYVGM